MKQVNDTTLQQIAENALTDSVVRLELWLPTSYHEGFRFNNDFVSILKREFLTV